MDTTKLFVSFGNPDHDSCGDVSVPPGTLNIPDSWAVGSGWPSFTVSLVKVNDGTFGKNAYGFGFAGCWDSGGGTVTVVVTGAPPPELVPHAANAATSNPVAAVKVKRENFISTPVQ
jgi:hypothetical protein